MSAGTQPITPDALVTAFAVTLAEQMQASSVCNALVGTSQIMSINCSDPATAKAAAAAKQSAACAAAVLAGLPSADTICNPCYNTGAALNASISLTTNCGSNAYEATMSKLGQVFAPTGESNTNYNLAFNDLRTAVENSAIIQSINQGVIVAQNINIRSASGSLSGAFQTSVIDTILTAIYTSKDVFPAFQALANALNAAPPPAAAAQTTPTTAPQSSNSSSNNSIPTTITQKSSTAAAPAAAATPTSSSSSSSYMYIIIAIVVFAAIGIAYSRKNKSSAPVAVGGQKITAGADSRR